MFVLLLTYTKPLAEVDAVVQIAMDFVRTLQQSDDPQDSGWTKLGPDSTPTWEHSEWLTSSSIERLLGEELNTSAFALGR